MTADRACELLADGLTPQEAIARLTPTTKPEAIQLARRLPLLYERPDTDRGAAIARIAARLGMKTFRLKLADDGRVIDDRYPFRHAAGAERTFPTDGGTVTHTRRYVSDKDHFQFLGHPEPGPWEIPDRTPLPLSPTGHWSHFAEPDAVVAMGGPEEYAAALVAAGREGADDFDRAFTGKTKDTWQPRTPSKPVVGTHTAKVMLPTPQAKPAASREPNLFDQADGGGRGERR